MNVDIVSTLGKKLQAKAITGFLVCPISPCQVTTKHEPFLSFKMKRH